MSSLVQLNLNNYVAIDINNPSTEEDITNISRMRSIPEQEVGVLLSYNVITFPQLAILTGVSESQLRNASVPSVKRNGVASCWLTLCNPFPDERKGKLFILLNQKCMEYIKKTLK